ncbi:MAG: FeoA family protein [Sinimarinibacterium sp.]
MTPLPMRLSDLPHHATALVLAVEGVGANDTIAHRLRDLGFVKGEPVRVVAHGPFQRDPLLVQIGFTRFALRRTEAQRVRVELAAA